LIVSDQYGLFGAPGSNAGGFFVLQASYFRDGAERRDRLSGASTGAAILVAGSPRDLPTV